MPQTSIIDAVMALREYVQEGPKEGLYVALISLDINGAFDTAWWSGILYS
jgi:hypothetical protein